MYDIKDYVAITTKSHSRLIIKFVFLTSVTESWLKFFFLNTTQGNGQQQFVKGKNCKFDDTKRNMKEIAR